MVMRGFAKYLGSVSLLEKLIFLPVEEILAADQSSETPVQGSIVQPPPNKVERWGRPLGAILRAASREKQPHSSDDNGLNAKDNGEHGLRSS
eukprot:87198-Pelagomonas_calceolata.AAC.6